MHFLDRCCRRRIQRFMLRMISERRSSESLDAHHKACLLRCVCLHSAAWRAFVVGICCKFHCEIQVLIFAPCQEIHQAPLNFSALATGFCCQGTVIEWCHICQNYNHWCQRLSAISSPLQETPSKTAMSTQQKCKIKG